MVKNTSNPAGNGKPKRSSHVPYQYAGYSLQTTRLAARLLTAEPRSILSLEVFEDVGVELPDGTRIAEQNKSSLDGNPVSDRAVDLWKTLSNWVDAVRNGELDAEKTKFEIYVSKPVSGALVEVFSKATTIDEASAALESARTRLWGEPTTRPEKSKVAESIRNYVDNVLDCAEAIAAPIIKGFSLLQASGIPQKDFEDLFRKTFVADEIIGLVADQALGWVKGRTDELLQQGKPANVKRDEFFNHLHSFIRRIDRQDLLRSFAPDPTQEQIDRDMAARVYVRQLQLINLEYDDQVEAVTDYLRAVSDRTIWSAKGLVHQDSFDEFEDNLRRAWKHLKTESDILASDKDESSRGKLLYSKCCRHTAKLQNMDLEDHFTRGGFHALSEEKSIGWHPDYKSNLA